MCKFSHALCQTGMKGNAHVQWQTDAQMLLYTNMEPHTASEMYTAIQERKLET